MTDQVSPTSEKLVDSQDNDQRDPQAPSDVPPSSSTALPVAGDVRGPSLQKAPEKVQGAPPLPPKSLDDSALVDLKQLGEFTYYRATSNQVTSPSREELPDDLEPTAEDLRSAQASLVARSRAYREAPLLTESLRKKKEEELLNRYPTTTIRIKFADRSMLEKSFPSTSFIKPIYAFVRSCLHEAAKPHKFVLYEPPRRELKVSDPKVRDKSLLDLHLAPRSILHFRFLEDDVKLNPVNGPPPLYPEMLSFFAVSLPQLTSQNSESSGSKPSGTKGSKLLDGLDKDKKIARLLKLGSGKK